MRYVIIPTEDAQALDTCLSSFIELHFLQDTHILVVHNGVGTGVQYTLSQRIATCSAQCTYVECDPVTTYAGMIQKGVEHLISALEPYPTDVFVVFDNVISTSPWADYLMEDAMETTGLLGVVSESFSGVQKLPESLTSIPSGMLPAYLRSEIPESDRLYCTTHVGGTVFYYKDCLERYIFQDVVDVRLKNRCFIEDSMSSKAQDSGIGLFVDLAVTVDNTAHHEDVDYTDWTDIVLSKPTAESIHCTLNHVVHIKDKSSIKRYLMSAASCKDRFDRVDLYMISQYEMKKETQKLTKSMSKLYGNDTEVRLFETTYDGSTKDGDRSGWSMLLYGDEVLSPNTDRSSILRLMCNPDPTTSGYSAKIMVMWDALTMYRTDGKWKDMSQIRTWKNRNTSWIEMSADLLCKSPNKLPAQNTTIVSSIHIQSLALFDKADRLLAYQNSETEYWREYVRTEQMTYRSLTHETNMGLTMLAYDKESPEGYAQWFRHMYGLCHRINMVWTDTEIPISERPDLMNLCDIYSACIIKKPLEDNIAQARNAGIDDLEESGCHWGCFFDPDEILPNTAPHIQELRECTLNTMCWGYLMSFMNKMHGRDGDVVTQSDSIRMFRLRKGMLRMNGAVHEGFDNGLLKLKSMNVEPYIEKFRHVVFHKGLAQSEEIIYDKLLKYRRLLIKDIGDNPSRCNSWVSLALQFYNDGEYEKARKCFEAAISVSNGAFLPFKEYGLRKLKIAVELLSQSVENMGDSNQVYQSLVSDLIKCAEPLTKDPLCRNEPLPEIDLPKEILDIDLGERI